MSTFNKLLIVSALAIGMQTASYASEYKKEVETIVHFTHTLLEQENAETSELIQWLEKKVIANDYPAAQNILVINAVITGNYSMDQKIAYLLEIKAEQDTVAQEEQAQLKKQKKASLEKQREYHAQWKKQYVRHQVIACTVALSAFIFGPAIIQASTMVGEDLGKKLLARINKPAPIAPRTPSNPDDYAGATTG